MDDDDCDDDDSWENSLGVVWSGKTFFRENIVYNITNRIASKELKTS